MNTENLYKIYQQCAKITTDSRNVPLGSCFFALKGDNFNGNEYAGSALKNGAAYAVVDDKKYYIGDGHYILVDNVYESLKELAILHRRQLNIPIIGITGTNGKTTTKELVNAVLSSKYITYTTQGNFNNHIGVPLTILEIKTDAKFAVIEMGANHQGEIAYLCEIARPDYGIITNVGKAHLEGFGGFEGVKKTKGELYDFLKKTDGIAFINSDDKDLISMSNDLTRISYGISSDSYCKGNPIENDIFSNLIWECKKEKGQIKSNLAGDYNFYNILASVCVANYFGIEPDLFTKAIENYVPSNNRSQIINNGSNFIIADCYNANPSSMAAALNNFFKIYSADQWVVLGQMNELGADSYIEHQKLYQMLINSSIEKIILIGELYNDLDIADKRIMHFSSCENAMLWFEKNKPYNKKILLKGSRGNKLERLLEGYL